RASGSRAPLAGGRSAFGPRRAWGGVVPRRYWSQSAIVWLGATGVALAPIVAAHRFAGEGRRFLEAHGQRLRRGLMWVVVLLAAYAYALRPALSAWAGGDGNDPARRWADPGPLLALGYRQLAAHDAQSLVRLGWF